MQRQSKIGASRCQATVRVRSRAVSQPISPAKETIPKPANRGDTFRLFDNLLAEIDETNNAAEVVFVTGATTGCVGDCNDDGNVGINELIIGVTITLGSNPPTACAAFDKNNDGAVAINEMIAAVNNALGQCG